MLPRQRTTRFCHENALRDVGWPVTNAIRLPAGRGQSEPASAGAATRSGRVRPTSDNQARSRQRRVRSVSGPARGRPPAARLAVSRGPTPGTAAVSATATLRFAVYACGGRPTRRPLPLHDVLWIQPLGRRAAPRTPLQDAGASGPSLDRTSPGAQVVPRAEEFLRGANQVSVYAGVRHGRFRMCAPTWWRRSRHPLRWSLQ